MEPSIHAKRQTGHTVCATEAEPFQSQPVEGILNPRCPVSQGKESQAVICLTRKATFSAAHFYYLPQLSEAKNQAMFRACSNRHGHGHNYELDVTVEGPLNPDTGMVINLKDLKRIIRQETELLDHANLNHQIPYFKDTIPTLENIAAYLWERLTPKMEPYGLSMVRMKLVEQDGLYVEWGEPLPKVGPLAIQSRSQSQSQFQREATHPMPDTHPPVFLTRRYDFCASHRLHNPAFSDEENREIYRQCNNINGHGHNYELEVTVAGTPDGKTGMLVDIVELDEAVKTHLIAKVDHVHLNMDVPFLDGINPTAENLVVAFWDQLAPHIQEPASLYRMRLVETKNNTAEYYGQVTAEASPQNQAATSTTMS